MSQEKGSRLNKEKRFNRVNIIKSALGSSWGDKKMIPEKTNLYTYRQVDSVRLECSINLDKLFLTERERSKFDENWKAFIDSNTGSESDSNNKKIFRIDNNRLTYSSEQLIPAKVDNRPPLLLVLGNPASHSIEAGMFFSFEKNRKEHRFWKDILKLAGILDLNYDNKLSVSDLNELRKKQLLGLDYKSPFRIGLCVFISMPSASNGPWSGIAGVQKLIGAKAMKRLENEERKRVIETATKFLSPKGIVVSFQKNAWNGLKSDGDPDYSVDLARQAKLKGRLLGMPNIPLFGVPPTRLSGPCNRILRKCLIDTMK